MRRFKTLFKSLIYLFSSLGLIFSSPMLSALSESQLDFFAQNDITFYDPEGENCSVDSPTLSSTGNNLQIIADNFLSVSIDSIKQKFPDLKTIDLSNSRSWKELIQIIKNTENLKPLTLISSRSTDLTKEDLIDLSFSFDQSKKIILLTNFSTTTDYQASNQLLREYTQTKNNLILVDWESTIKNKTNLLINDQPNPEAQTLLAELIYKTINSAPSGSGNINTTINNRDYKGEEIISKSSLDKINNFKSLYEKGANKHNIPWQILATIHYKESGLSRKNPRSSTAFSQGLFGLTSPTKVGTINPLAQKGLNHAFDSGKETTDDEFLGQIELAAEIIASNASSYKIDLRTDLGIKKSFFHYNGANSLYKAQAKTLGYSEDEANSGEGSPYVMNRADAKRTIYKGNPHWGIHSNELPKEYKYNSEGKYYINTTYLSSQPHGAFLVFSAIGGPVSGAGGFSSCSNYISSGGLTYEQAVKLVKRYGRDQSDGYKLLGEIWKTNKYHNDINKGGGNCVTMSIFFIKKFTNISNVTQGYGNGNQFVTGFSNRHQTPVGSTPAVWSVFSRNNSNDFGHTGVVVGIHNNKIITVEADWSSSATGEGNGNHGTGSGYVSEITIKNGRLFTRSGEDVTHSKFTYLDNYIDLNKINNFISGY